MSQHMALYNDDNYVNPRDTYKHLPGSAPVPFMETNIDRDIDYIGKSSIHSSEYVTEVTKWYIQSC